MSKQRQQILVLGVGTPELSSGVGAWAFYDGVTGTRPETGSEDKPPYASVLAAMQDGWRVIQFPPPVMHLPGVEYATGPLKFEYVLERMVEVE